MKRILCGLGAALLVALCAASPMTLHAQADKPLPKGEDKPLNKKVTLDADNERLEAVLADLSKKGHFTFSYQSDQLQKDKLVTITIRESTLREALELILGKAYEYVESDDYVVIRRNDVLATNAAMAAKMAKAGYVEMVKPKYIAKSMAYAIKPKLAMEKLYFSDSLNTRDSLNISALRQTVRNIIGDMVTDGIIRDKENFKWFALDNGQFVVDGRQMPDSLRTKYATKYVKPDGSGYYCGTLVGVTGRGYFFDKQEIFGGKKE